LFAGLAGETRVKRAQSTAYLTAYPNCSNGNSAEAAASRLLRRVKPIIERVRELQAEHTARLKPKIDISRERIGRKLDRASELAEQLENPAAMVSAELGLAKVFHSIRDDNDTQRIDWNTTTSMKDIGCKLLQSVGFASPDDVSIQAAIEANDVFIAELERIHDRAQGLTIDQDD
jgi:hypothetical protein